MMNFTADFWRHLGAQIALAGVMGALNGLGHLDVATLGALGPLYSALVAIATEVINQKIA